MSGGVIAQEPTKSGHEKHEGIVNSSCSRADRGRNVGPWVTSDAVAAVDVEHLAADEVGPVGGEEADRLGDVDRVAEAPQRDVAGGDLEGGLVEITRRHQPGRHAVGEHPRAHAVGPDAEAALLGGDGPHDRFDRSLGARRQAVADRVAAGGGGGDRHDAAARLAQGGKGRLQDVEEADGLALDLGPVGRRLDPAQVDLGHVGPGGVHERVQPTEALDGALHDGGGRRLVDEVEGRRPRVDPERPQLGLERLGRGGVGPVGERHGAAPLGQHPADRRADATAAARDQRRAGAASEVVHHCSCRPRRRLAVCLVVRGGGGDVERHLEQPGHGAAGAAEVLAGQADRRALAAPAPAGRGAPPGTRAAARARCARRRRRPPSPAGPTRW